MKPIQVMFDERLLARLDATNEVQKEGRSAVLRRATLEYLKRRQQSVIAERYAKAYGASDTSLDGLTGESPGWEDEGEWPVK